MKTFESKRWLVLFSLILLSGPLARAQSPGPGSALNLDGVSGYAQATNGVWFNGNFTVEGWVFARSYNNWSRLIDFANGPNTNNVFLALSAGTTGFPVFGVYTNNNGAPSIQSSTQLPLNQWVHLAATLNGTTGTIYINGNAVGSGTLNVAPNVVRTNNYISRSNYAGDANANAVFDEIRIWNVARTQGQIQAAMHRSLLGNESGLLGYWRCDEGTGTNIADASGHGNGVKLVGASTWTNSTAPLMAAGGSALNFNSASCQTVSIPHQAALNAYPLTVMTWFMVPTNSNGGALVNKYVSSSKNGYQIFLAGTLRAWYFHDSVNNVFNNGVMDAGPVNDGLWHHAALAVDAAGGRLYLDGVLKSSIAWSGTPGAPTTTQPLSFGIYPGDSCFTGQMDEVSIWNTAFSTAQIQAAMNHTFAGNEPGLAGYWRLDEDSGTITADNSGQGNSGTLNGAPTWIASGAPLVVSDPGYGLHFNGTNSYADIPGFANVIPTNEITIEFWQRVDAAQNQSTLSVNPDSLTDRINVHVPWSDGSVYWDFGNINTAGRLSYTPSNSIVGSWTHFAFVASQSSNYMAIFQNGLQVAQKTGMTPFTRAGQHLMLGAIANGVYFKGSLDEVRVWNLARSATQISQNFKNTLIGNEAGLVAYYRLDEGTGTSLVDAMGNGYNGTLINNPTWITSGAALGAPQVATLAATGVAATSATLNGTVNGKGRPTAAWFLYGMTTNYGSTSTSFPISGTNFAAVPISSPVSGLSPGMTYHFQLVASNSAGTTAGGDLTFTTIPGFTAVNSGLPAPADYGLSAAWGDFNNDGRLDLVTENTLSRNNGNGTFSQVSIGLPSRLGNGAQGWGDVDNDGYLDLLITGNLISPNQPITQLWHNNGNGTFTLVTNTGLPNFENSSIAFGDFDNDGRQDLLLMGRDGTNPNNTVHLNSGIWHNNGNGTFTKISIPALPPLWNGSVACADFNNDGYMDFMITGQDSDNSGVTQIWRNNGNGTFTQMSIPGVPQPYNGTLAVGDYDADGRLDFLITGQMTASTFISQVWSNGGNWNFTQDTQVALPGLYLGTAIWGDFDNDGKLDILLSGGTTVSGFLPGAPVTQVWRNLGGGQFVDMTAGLPAVRYYNAAACGDFNNDGKLDALLVGFSPSSFDMELFLEQNNTPATNTPPSAPAGLQAAVNGFGILFSWNAAGDAQTVSSGLSYNLRVGTIPGGSDIVSPQADPATGFRRVPQLGNAQERLTAIITNLHSGTYYWSVQAIDTAFAGSPFATEAQFTLTNGLPYPPMVTTLSASSITTTSATLNGTVNPQGGITGAWFQWGTTTNYGMTTTTNDPGAGVTNVPVSFALTNLSPGVTYHYRLTAGNAGGTTLGADMTFTLLAAPPTITYQSGGSINPPTSAMLSGGVVANGADTTAWFQYGLSTNYGTTTVATTLSGTNFDEVVVSSLITNLSVGTLYHYQLVASNALGTTTLGDSSFTTPTFSITSGNLPGPSPSGIGGLSAAWGDFNNDGFLDVLMERTVSRNNGNGSFSQISIGLPSQLASGAQAWADFDNDGYLDILVTGSPGQTGQGFETALTQLWHNNGDGTFTLVPDTGLPNLVYSAIAVGDFDNDGKQDVLLMGATSGGQNPGLVAGIWRNIGTNTFSLLYGVGGLQEGGVAAGDFDKDGYLDFLITGRDGNNQPHTQMWRNNGDGTFVAITIAGLPQLSYGSFAVGDYNNDGKLDFLLTGALTANNYISQVWSNNGNGTFTRDTNVSLPGVWSATAAWGDYDNDGSPDILLAGATGSSSGLPASPLLQLWRNLGAGNFAFDTASVAMRDDGVAWGDFNNDGRLDFVHGGFAAFGSMDPQVVLAESFIPATNTPPTAPTGLQASPSGFGVVLSWNAATDAQTPAPGLSYNIRVGTSPGGFNIVSPQADPATGFRRVPQLGNAQERLMAILTNLPAATYYWSVQAIDPSFAGSPFPSEGQFTIGTPMVVTQPAAPVIGSTAVLNGLVGSMGSATAAWFRWGTTTNYGNTTPVTMVSATNPSAVAVSNLLTGLTFGPYHFQLVASNAAGITFGSDMSFSVALFANVASSIPPLYFGSVAWGDFNNDGLLDLLVTGATDGSVSFGVAEVWQNLGNGSFSNINVSLPGVSESSVSWADFDNDGFLDILLTGVDTSGNPLSQLWHNNGDGTFSLTSAGLPGVGSSAVALADFDNDGRLDILLTGSSSSGLISQVWRNQGDGTFANLNVPLPGVYFGSVACNDFDKDDNVDILLTGVGNSGRLTQLWRNNGNGTFTKINAGLPAVRESSVAWADFDNDGYPDILLTGGGLAQIWHNNGNGTFTNLNVDLPDVAYSAVAVGDFDNDGLPDFLLSGTTNSTAADARTRLFRNLGNGSFTNAPVNLPGAWLGASAWGDFNNDGRLDFLITGWDTNSTPMTLLWQNLSPQTNSPPTAPAGLAAVAGASAATLNWTPGVDAQTPAAGLTYNVRVGTNSGGGQILSPESGPDGFRRVVQTGNAQQGSSITLRGLTAGTTYYWSVQSVDSSFAGSPFSPEGTFVVGAPGVLTGPSSIASATSEQLTGSVNPNGLDSTAWFDWGTSTTYGSNTALVPISGTIPGAVGVTNLIGGLIPGTVYHYRVVATNGLGINRGADSTFTVPLPPSVTTLAATAVVPTSALLNGTVIPNNAPTLAVFQWGTSTSYGSTSAPISLSATNVAAVALSNLLTSLTPNTQYHFRLSASNVAGVGSGGDLTFTTPAPSAPSVTSLPAEGITPNRATLKGTAAANGAATAAWFQWGLTSAYGNNTALFAIDATNLSALAVSNSLSGLAGGTLYYYRLAATNSAGTNFGAGLTFTTLPVSAPTATTLAATAVTATSATVNGSLNPNGADTLAWFQFGTNTSYGNVTPAAVISSNASTAVSLSNSLSGLLGGVVYHFQLVASNSVGVSLGGDLTFLPPLFTPAPSGLPNLFYSSAAWGDFNNDGHLDILLSGFDGTNPVTQVWQNLGNGSFSNVNAGLPGFLAGAVAWGDYDNDGFLDILQMGADSNFIPATQLWHNNGNGTFTQKTNNALTGLFYSSALAWGDYDNDGKLDFFVSGADASFTPVSQLWHNDGNGSFTRNTNVAFAQLYSSAVAWGDYDKDGRLDLLLTGADGNGAPVTQLWHNDGNGVFTLNTNTALPAVYFGPVAWGDYDNDGRLDILLTGNNGTHPICQLWHNEGNGTFALNADAVLPAVYNGSAAWGDYDSDGRLDILLTGLDSSNNPLSQIWRNNGNGTFSAVNVPLPAVFFGAAVWGDLDNDGKLDVLLTGGSVNNSGSPDAPITALFSNVGLSSNTPPAAPSALTTAVQSFGQVLFSWNAASDAQTPANGLSYNLRIGTTPGGRDVLAPEAAAANGFRRLPQLGNAQGGLSNIVTRLSSGTYYWSVQAIDASFAGGPFAPESTFSIVSTPPVITSFAYVAGQFQVRFNGQAGGNYTLQGSTDLLQWVSITNLTVPTNGTYQVQDPAASSFPRRFYRLSVH